MNEIKIDFNNLESVDQQVLIHILTEIALELERRMTEPSEQKPPN